ncbi:Piso0_000248 [Millerozyma farinosa CBS 7064]|uniref:Piso0_000248 protein n=1 Tax=Pichia sorbitophila (strain ATCC MYA-4447 / BCRC 22081 / CBS 7064 / NBRC 10061 / NRRL Y-12695) TaxID=559304 RepID=G8YTG8_PICSO|nr:Piso0_000248 [Millerozyma farinosa CBS 7064]
MGPGRPRRRTKVQQPPQPHIPQQNRPIIKEEANVKLHDDADLISYRNDALKRFITNQEYLENIVSKPIHTSKIVPPRSFPEPLKREKPEEVETKDKFESLKHNDIYFGDIKILELKNEHFQKEIEELKKEKHEFPLDGDEKCAFQKNSIQRLADLQQSLTSETSYDLLGKEVDSILETYRSRFKENYREITSINKFSRNVNDISDGKIVVTSAPSNYDPRSINSFINLNVPPESGSNDGMNVDFDGMPFENNSNNHNIPYLGQLEDPKYNDITDIASTFNQQLGVHAGPDNYMDQVEQTRSEVPQADPSANDDINKLVSESLQTNEPNENNDIVNEMEDLISFQNVEDDDMINDAAFDQEFLTQMDHSLE